MPAGQAKAQVAVNARPDRGGRAELIVSMRGAAPGKRRRMIGGQPHHIPAREEAIAGDGVLGGLLAERALIPALRHLHSAASFLGGFAARFNFLPLTSSQQSQQ